MRYESLVQLLEGFHGARVLVFGDVMLDRFVYGTVERISPEAPIPVVKMDRQADMAGGAANVARNMADLGANAVLIGVVGRDADASDLRARLAGTPTISAHLIEDDSRPTTVKTRYVAEGQQVMRADRESTAPVGAPVAERLLAAYSAELGQVDLVVISDYAKGAVSSELAGSLIDLARARGKRIVVDPKSRDFSKYRGATVITPNRLELKYATGEECTAHEHVAAAATRILDEGICEHLVVTRGKDGMSVVGRGGDVHLPTTARQVFDVSGAGDTVVAALALALIAGADVIEAASLANIAAGIVVSKRGTATVSTGEIVATLAPSDGRTDPMKIFTPDSGLELVRRWRAEGLKVAFTNGCFDLLHPGHISLLNQARRTADRLVVGVNADISISRLKGPDRPVQGEVARATVLAAIKSVDAVVIFAEDTPLELIDLLSPDVLVKGADYTIETVVGAQLVQERGGKVVLAELLTGHSTTDTVKRAARITG
jgi:D-beta-D-heptose 7-phosphate kinase / D-beta-D-heptose 1-phosphate adenosyltransferase